MERPDELKSDPEVAQLKAEISENQSDLQETVAAIQDRFSPAHLKDQASTTVRRATIGRMQHMMNTNNPVPYALIGIGAAWLLASHRSAGHHGNGGTRSDDDRFRSAYGSTGHSTTSEWQEAATERADAVAERARRAAGEARHKWNSALNHNPMALGIAALAAGALVGAVLPVTETENEYLGKTRDTAVDSARSLVKDTVQKAAGTDEPI